MPGTGGLAALAERMRTMGRDGDTVLAHINPQEAMQLMRMGGRGSVNPRTGLPEFAQRGTFDTSLYASRNPDVVAALGEDPEALWQHYETFGRGEGRVANQSEILARTEGYGGTFGGGGYAEFAGLADDVQDVTGRSQRDVGFAGGAIEDPARRDALNQALADAYGYGGYFGQGGFAAFSSVQTPEIQQNLRDYIGTFQQNYVPPGTVPATAPGQVETYTAFGTAEEPVYMPDPTPGVGGVLTTAPGGIETVGVSRSHVTYGDVLDPIDYDAPATPFDQAMQDQGVGVRYFIYELGLDGRLVKKYVPSNTPGAQQEYVGVYGTVGGEHTFSPNFLGGLPDELNVEETLGLD